MSRILFEDLYKAFKGIVCIFDKNDIIQYTNKEFRKLLGYYEGELEGKLITDLIVHDEKSVFFDMFYFDYMKHDSVVKFYHKSGAFRFFSIKVYNLPMYNQIIGHVIKRDYSSYEASELNEDKNYNNKVININNLSELIKSNTTQLDLILDAIPVDIWIKDRQGRYIFTNSTICQHTDVTKESYYMKNDFEIYDKEVANEFLESDHAAIESKNKISYNFEIDTSNILSATQVTKIPVFNDKDEHVGLVSFAVDKTDTKKLEKELLDIKSKLDFFTVTSTSLMFEILANGELVYIAGKLADEFNFFQVGSNVFSYFTKVENHPELIEKFNLALNGKGANIQMTLNNINLKIKLTPKYNSEKDVSILGYAYKE